MRFYLKLHDCFYMRQKPIYYQTVKIHIYERKLTESHTVPRYNLQVVECLYILYIQ